MRKCEYSKYLSNKITHIYFIMSVLVVYIHIYDSSYSAENTFFIEQTFEDIISQGIARSAVPLFFILAGFLTFSTENYAMSTFTQDIKRKIKRLFVPYIVWNTIYGVFHIILTGIVGNEIGFGALSLLQTIFVYKSNAPFWYILQLLVLYALSPLLLSVYRKKILFVPFLLLSGGGYLFIIEHTKFFLLPGILFYSIGGIIALNYSRCMDFEKNDVKTSRIVSILGLIAVIILMLYRIYLSDISCNISDLRDTVPFRLFEFTLPIAIWFASDCIKIGNLKVNRYEKRYFNIYCMHPLFITLICTLNNMIIETPTPVYRLVFYAISPIGIIVMIIVISELIERSTPFMYKVLFGNRK